MDEFKVGEQKVLLMDGAKRSEVDEMLQALDEELPQSLDEKHEEANELLDEIHGQIQFLHELHKEMDSKE